MRQGFFPGQMDALRQLARKGLDYERRSRRNFFISALACVGLGTAGFVVGRGRRGESASSPPSADDADPRLTSRRDQARRMAARSDEILRRDHATFLLILEGVGGDAALWVGFERLANMALDGSTEGDRQLALRLLTTTRSVTPPGNLAELVGRLENLVR